MEDELLDAIENFLNEAKESGPYTANQYRIRIRYYAKKLSERLGRYRVEAKNASNGLETPANGSSEDAIRELWDDMKANSYGNESPFMVRMSFGQFSAAIARWLEVV